MITYLPGEAVGDRLPWPRWAFADSALVQLGQWLRRLHDATADFTPPADERWFIGSTMQPGLIVGHQDAAPYNAVMNRCRNNACTVGVQGEASLWTTSPIRTAPMVLPPARAFSLIGGSYRESSGSDTEFRKPMTAFPLRARWLAIEWEVPARLALGEHASLMGELEILARDNPFDEARYAHRILAPYRSGRLGVIGGSAIGSRTTSGSTPGGRRRRRRRLAPLCQASRRSDPEGCGGE
ncbi:hypothetical protein ONA70_21875 [Micromonospora yasonensis]|uniref:BTAD domain-containing putative transcriptional regulator n=1 Tax=Micromonospora yasonensis TaxID=1128667 RepID=UPI0022304C64|nr:BTAD domain-containing putative transcriptional regulator [Micromonospora yasonensis]MCW3842753.1 hypothetical protein [Micromonospora yasonensis]